MIARLARQAMERDGSAARRGSLIAFRDGRILAVRRGSRALLIADVVSLTLIASSARTAAEARAVNELMTELSIEARLVRSGDGFLVVRRRGGTLRSVEGQ